MSKKSGGFWGFIKRIFGFGQGGEQRTSFPIVPDEVIDAELNESFVYDDEKNRRQAEAMIAGSFEEEKISPNDPSVLFQRATGYSILGENEKALETLDKILAADPAYIDAYRLKAGIYEDAEDYEKVVDNLSRAISLHEAAEMNEPAADRGGVVERVEELLTRIDWREKVDDYGNRGAAYFNLSDFEAAIDDFTSALGLDAGNDYLYASRAEAYLETGAPGKALEDLNRAIEIDASQYNYAKRAEAHRRVGNLDGALGDVSKAIELHETNPPELAYFFDGYFLRGEIHMEKGDYNDAVRDFTAQIEKDPEFIEPYEMRAAAYRRLGMDSRAAADEQKAAELSAENSEDSI